MSALLDIFTFTLFVVNSIFDGLDSVFLGSYSFLDILITLFIFDRILWFIFKLLGHSGSSTSPDIGDGFYYGPDIDGDSTLSTGEAKTWSNGWDHDGAGNLRKMN